LKTLSPHQLFHIFEAASGVDGAFVVGGQALNIWAERYAGRCSELSEYAPFTSKDLDYFGTQDAARLIAERLGGKLKIPKIDDHTPNTALLIIELDGEKVVVDFIGHVLGIHDRDVRKMIAIIAVPMLDEGEKVDVAISLMHPYHCLVSRVVNIFSPAMQRSDDTAYRQLNAAVYVLREYINDLLIHKETRRATRILKMLYKYLRSDLYGCKAHILADKDPLDILQEYSADKRFDPRFRPYISGWCVEILGRRKNRGQMTALRQQ